MVPKKWMKLLEIPLDVHNMITDQLTINDLAALAEAGELKENLGISIHARVLITIRFV